MRYYYSYIHLHSSLLTQAFSLFVALNVRFHMVVWGKLLVIFTFWTNNKKDNKNIKTGRREPRVHKKNSNEWHKKHYILQFYLFSWASKILISDSFWFCYFYALHFECPFAPTLSSNITTNHHKYCKWLKKS